MGNFFLFYGRQGTGTDGEQTGGVQGSAKRGFLAQAVLRRTHGWIYMGAMGARRGAALQDGVFCFSERREGKKGFGLGYVNTRA
jgi:hypothetical protein